jgi:PAS domain S-box-containing protein
MSAARDLVDLRRSGKFSTASGVVQEQRGKALMDEIRRHVGAMQNEEQRLLVQRTASRASRERAVAIVIAVGSLISFGLVALMLRIIRQDVELQQRTARERDALLVREQASREQLAAIQRVTDSALGPLELDHLLTELMSRVKEVLSVDTACVLLLMRDGVHLELCKCVGPTEEIEDRVLIPIGEGVEGRIAARCAAATVDDIAAENVYDPVVREHFRSLLGAPLMARAGGESRVIGVVHVETVTPRHFMEAERDLLMLVAERAGEAIERARLYQAQRRGEERFRLLVEGVQDYAIYMLDTEGRVASWNEGAERLTGYTTEQALGKRIDTLLYTPEDSAGDTLERIITEARERGHFAFSGWRVRRDGTRFWADVVTTAMHDEDDDHLLGFASVTRDLTERRRAEEALVAARDAAQAADRAKGQFLATMSHEIRTPINAIIGYSDLLELGLDGPLTEPQLARLARVRGSARHLLGLVNEVLDLAKIEAEQLRVEHVRASVADAVTIALGLVYPQASGKSLAIANSCPLGSEGSYMGDPHRVEQVLVNLLSNAVKFTAHGGRIDVDCGLTERPSDDARLSNSDCWCFVRITDTGVGIPPEQQDRIFEPFVQAVDGEGQPVNIYSRQHGGTGLGLAISRRLARLMGGDVTVQSKPNDGSTFTLWLPAPPDVRVNANGEATGCRTEERRVHRRPAKGLASVGIALRNNTDDAMRLHARRLRSELKAPNVDAISDAELEDHVRTLVVDLASALVFIEDAGGEASQALRDGTEIQRLISERHGAQRASLGWTEAHFRSEITILREVIETTLRRRHSSGPEDNLTTALVILRRLFEHVERTGVRGFEQAREDTSSLA